MTSLLDDGLSLRAAGISSIPIACDGSKAPAGALLPLVPDEETGEPVHSWKPYQSRIATEAELHRWLAVFRAGMAVVCGMVSGNLGVLDFEFLDFFLPFCELVEAQAPGLVSQLPLVATPGKDADGGRHLYFRSASAGNGSAKLALLSEAEAVRRNGNKRRNTAIELKGEGGYVLAPGCPAACHPSGRLYRHIGGPFLEEVPTLPDDQVSLLLSCARALTQQAQAVVQDIRRPAAGGSGDRPGDRFNRTATWTEILEPHGWTLMYCRKGAEFYRRPGKEEKGISASAGFCSNEQSGSLLAVFSTNAEPFEGPRGDRLCSCYSKFSAWTLLNFGGDFTASADALADMGLDGPELPAGIGVRPDADPDPLLLKALLANDRRFRASWEHRRPEFGDRVRRYEQSLASLAAAAGWPDQGVVDLVIAHRRRWRPETVARILGGNYLGAVLAKARAGVRVGVAKKGFRFVVRI
jgi:putative DNA primase/helicase